MSVTRGQCDARPTVTFPAAIPPIGWYQIILLGDRGTCVNNLSMVALDRGAAGIRNRKSGTLPLRHRATHKYGYDEEKNFFKLP